MVMRLTGGMVSGRLLKVPKGLAVRPTPDLVKQAVFNSLGTGGWRPRAGALRGFRCPGPGMPEPRRCGVVAVEKAGRHTAIIRQNLARTGIPLSRLEVRTQDVFPALARLVAASRQFDLILADPPFGEKNLGRPSTSLS